MYVQNESVVRGKHRLELRFDPPPDLVVEIDITRSSLNTLKLFESLGVPEVWRFNGAQSSIHVRGTDGYVSRDRSAALPAVSVEDATTLIAASRQATRVVWLRRAQA